MKRLRLDAIDCDLIAKLATDDEKQAAFAALAAQYRTMTTEIERKVVAHRIERQLDAIAKPRPVSRR